jgi:hypothetical protein
MPGLVETTVHRSEFINGIPLSSIELMGSSDLKIVPNPLHLECPGTRQECEVGEEPVVLLTVPLECGRIAIVFTGARAMVIPEDLFGARMEWKTVFLDHEGRSPSLRPTWEA